MPELKELAIDLLRELSSDMTYSLEISRELEEDLDDLDAHEQNVRKVKNLPPIMNEIEEVIRAADAAIPARKRDSRIDPNS